MRGPHAALAARLAARDPGRSFVLGQRIQYVLLPGTRLQVRHAESGPHPSTARSPTDLSHCLRSLM